MQISPISSIGASHAIAYTADMSELLSPLEWFFVILLAVVPLLGLGFHLWIMLLGHGNNDKRTKDQP
jgi:hypothetical protein